MKKRTIFLTVLIAILGAGFFYYYKMGGFNEPEISQAQTGPYYLAGKYYEGKVNSKDLGQLFEKSEQLVKEGVLKGEPAALFYSDPDKNDGNVKAFVGAIIADTSLTLPDSFEIRRVPQQEVIKANLKAHFTVAPVGIYQEVRRYASENKFAVSDTTLEIYHSLQDLTVEVPYKKE